MRVQAGVGVFAFSPEVDNCWAVCRICPRVVGEEFQYGKQLWSGEATGAVHLWWDASGLTVHDGEGCACGLDPAVRKRIGRCNPDKLAMIRLLGCR